MWHSLSHEEIFNCLPWFGATVEWATERLFEGFNNSQEKARCRVKHFATLKELSAIIDIQHCKFAFEKPSGLILSTTTR